MKNTKKEKDRERCNQCGDSVAFGSGKFVNRIPDLNDISTRRSMNRKYIWGDFVCIECDEKNSDS
ncbi:MAG TPA: hypothetical protein PK079_22685 [Leptospiraceae bacterium]|nr:hypothetical protein [Leptospiraceae bacterium]HMW04407.1 hypothetical protein [Leptospiraceae bacterium]HMY34117.1 hypothetical protein [Leptospiraceae bacterium]HMZ63828.1 hypothetical protein [Leptospiraceae bacterium]HNA10221.1 hypothetical protein [Leptospiraceae bacterium]